MAPKRRLFRQEAAAHHAARAAAHQEADGADRQPYITSDGMVNHFKLMWDMRLRFPLHFIVFEQVSSHIAHKANVEQYFSRAV